MLYLELSIQNYSKKFKFWRIRNAVPWFYHKARVCFLRKNVFFKFFFYYFFCWKTLAPTTIYDELRDFLKEHFPAYHDDTTSLIEEIKMFELKNKSNTKIPKFTLQIYDFVYDTLMTFALCDFIFETVTTKNLFEDVYIRDWSILKSIFIIHT